MKRHSETVVRTPALALIARTALAYAGNGYEINRFTIDGGGVMRSTGGDFELSRTIGQADADPDAPGLTGGEFDMAGGFWFPLAAGDCNADGGVNLFDYDPFEARLTGPDGTPLRPGCACFDLDGDNDVDLHDAAEFQRNFSGS